MSCTNGARIGLLLGVASLALVPTFVVADEHAPSPVPAPVTILPGSAQQAKPKAAAQPQFLPQVLREIEEKYSKSQTLTAEFSQVEESATTKQKKTSTGKLAFKRPNKIRWETLAPDKNLLVSDGQTFWYYTPPFDEGESGQYMERKSAQTQSRLAQALLSGRFSVARDMKIRSVGAMEFALTPKKGGSIQEARIQVDPKERVIRKVTLLHRGGNRSEITLSQITLGNPIADDQFHFTPPPHTDRIQE